MRCARSCADLRQAFELFDRNKDGHISAQELGTVMRQLGFSPSDKEIRRMIAEVDKNSTCATEGLPQAPVSRAKCITAEIQGGAQVLVNNTTSQILGWGKTPWGKTPPPCGRTRGAHRTALYSHR